MLENENLNEPLQPQLNIGAVICSACSACGAENSIRWEKKSIGNVSMECMVAQTQKTN